MRQDLLVSAVAAVGLAGLSGGLSACSSPSLSPSQQEAPSPAQVDTSRRRPCPRFPVGSIVAEPPDLFSHAGVLPVHLFYNTSVDADGRALYCFMTADGKESPTLHVHPGDHLVLVVTNNVPESHVMEMTVPAPACGASTMSASSVNVHYHGTNTSPTCHSDEVIRTTINSGQTFTYNVAIPLDEPPGLYWYHPHIHGMAEPAVLGGASGAIIVEGLENVQPAVAGLAQRVLVIRDQVVPGNPAPGGPDNVPSWDLSLNYVPIPFPSYTPPVIQMRPGKRQLFRVVNASADTIIDLQAQFDGRPQTLEVVGLDGVPTGSQDGTRRGKVVPMTHILLPTAARAEFILTGPPRGVKSATLLTMKVDTGPIGDNDPQRPLATIHTGDEAPEPPVILLPVPGPANPQRFEGLAGEKPVTQRTLYFSEVLSDPKDPLSPTNFFITVDGDTPVLFDPNNPPAIVTTQGAVEDWTVQNRTAENHEFHIHQIHFLPLLINGQPVPPQQQQFLDMIQVPYWSGSGPYPSVTLRMDFRGPYVGDFVYHCHILGHEDNGMMALIRVKPRHRP